MSNRNDYYFCSKLIKINQKDSLNNEYLIEQ